MLHEYLPVIKLKVGENLKAGIHHEIKLEITIESEVAKPFTTLSAYFITNATSSPPQET